MTWEIHPASLVSSASRHKPAAISRSLIRASNSSRRHPRDVLLVEPVQLLRIEDGVAAADAFEREQLDQLLAREHFAVATRRPSEQRQEIHHGLGKVPETLVLDDRRRAVTLAQPFLVGPEDQRHVSELRRRPAERLIQQHLFRGVRNVIVATNDVRDLHADVVDDDRQLIGRLPVRSQDRRNPRCWRCRT